MTQKMLRGRTQAEDGTELSYYWRSGAEGPKPLVVLPGLGMPGQTCFTLLETLGPDRPVAVIEPRGSGLSGPIRAPVKATVFADDAATVLHELAWDRVHVAGISMGGMIAQHMVVQHRPLLLSASLVNTYARADTWAALVWRLREALALLEDPSTQRLAAALFLTGPADVSSDPAIVDTLFELWETAPADPTSYREQMSFCANHDLYHKLQGTDVPGLVISGANDLLCTPRAGEELAEATGSQYVCLDNATHLLVTARPGEVASLIEQHLQATESQHAS